MEKVLESRKCTFCGTDFHIYEKDKAILEFLSPTFEGKKYLFPLPTECPNCRRQKRLSWRNEHKLYRRKCDFSGESILSFYHSETPHPVYEKEIWMSDKWSPLKYGRDYDFTRPFFDQFLELKSVTPHFSRSILKDENSLYSNNATSVKNCYLCFNGGEAEDCLYTIMFKGLKDCVDCYCIEQSESCYESTDIFNCQKLFYSQDCKDCFNGYFLKNCINCKNCFLSKNLTNKEYYFMNKQYTKEEYEKKVTEMLSSNTTEDLYLIFETFSTTLPEKYMHGVQNENVENADYVSTSKDVFYGHDIRDSENIRYSARIIDRSKNIMDVEQFGWELENCYMSAVIGHNSSRLFFCFDCRDNIENVFYSIGCVQGTKNSFGCVSLNNYQYCILNKQYTKEEYEKLVPRIVEHMQSTGEWGKYFPPYLSSYGYNQTVAVLNYPLTREEAIDRGFNWSDYSEPFPKVDKIIPASKLPKDISKVPDDILNWAIECAETKKPFRVTKQELDFYRLHNISLPKKHHEVRHLERFNKRNSFKTLFDRKCDKCSKGIRTTYSPERPEKILCEQCYTKEVN